MEFQRLLELAADLHCFSPGMLTAGEDLDQIRVQLSRWAATGRVVRIHKGWYVLGEPFRRVRPDMNVIACALRPGAYVSLHSALAFHGMIPEYVPETTCVTTGRPLRIDSPLGRIRYRHLKTEAFLGYRQVDFGMQAAFLALPEKALLDLVYLTPGSAEPAYLVELRLQRPEELDLERMARMAERFEAPRLARAVGMIAGLVQAAGAEDAT